ncbi:MAG: V-type ATP synthase subunit I [Firmicutes bacterium]|nr:V-type ATP synthase subunit I [Bacillota bacterium]
MSLAPMTRIAIVTPKTLRDELLNLLQKVEAVEITDLIETDLLPPETETAEEISQRIQQLTGDLKKVQSTIRFLRETFRPKQSIIDQFASTRLPVPETLYYEVANDPKSVIDLCSRVQDLERQWSELNKLKAHCEQELESLKPWLNLDVPLKDVGETAYCQIKLGVFKIQVYPDLVLEAQEELVDCPIHLEVINETSQEVYVFVIYQKDKASQVSTLLSKYGFSEVVLPEDYGSIHEAYQDTVQKLESIQKQMEKIHQQLAEWNESAAQVYSLSDILRSEIQKAEAAQKFGYTGHAVVVNGWCRADRYADLKKAVEEAIPVCVVEAREPAEDEVPPVDFDNPKLVKPYEIITTTAGIPKQGSPDPTPALAPFFFAFFGIALGDAGYGIILTILAIWLMKRTRAVGDGKNFLKVLIMGGVSTFAFGVVTGSWFGDLLPIGPIWFNPVDDPIRMLIVALVLGLLHLYVGLGVTFVHNLKNGRVWDAIFDQGLWWVFISGLALMIIGAGKPAQYAAIAGGLGLVLTQGRKEKSLLKKIFKGIASLTGVSDYLSDVLSYSRLLALGLATSVIGVVINDVSAMVGDIPIIGIFIVAVILVFGHLFNMLINVVSAYVHTSRLQYVEFFSKCFESGGRLFKPFALRTKMVQIVADREEQFTIDYKGGALKWKLHGGQH